MPVNASEKFLTDLAERSFLALWTIPNPFRKAGKELTDLLVVFGKDIIIISDKAQGFDSTRPNAWERWKRKTVDASLKQLATATKAFQNPRTLFLDAAATTPFPYRLPAPADQRYHLINIARPSHDPSTTPTGWDNLIYDTDATDTAFTVTHEYANGFFTHVFDSDAIEFLLSQLDTTPDFLDYLKSREDALRSVKSLRFKERDLFATAVESWRTGERFQVRLPPASLTGRVELPTDLWENYIEADGPTLRSAQYATSKNFDIFINHFHNEFSAGRMLNSPKPSYDMHEAALRIMASESRFARRIIVDSLTSIYWEDDKKTFWASTVASPENPKVRYVWLTYPGLPPSLTLEEWEAHISQHLKRHTYVARSTFGPAIYVGIALPNEGVGMASYFINVMDGEIWSEEQEAEAQHWKTQNIFTDLEAMHRRYTP